VSEETPSQPEPSGGDPSGPGDGYEQGAPTTVYTADDFEPEVITIPRPQGDAPPQPDFYDGVLTDEAEHYPQPYGSPVTVYGAEDFDPEVVTIPRLVYGPGAFEPEVVTIPRPEQSASGSQSPTRSVTAKGFEPSIAQEQPPAAVDVEAKVDGSTLVARAFTRAAKQRFSLRGAPVPVARPIAGRTTWSQHAYGNAVDLSGTPEAMAAAAEWARVNAGQLRVRYVIWNHQVSSFGSPWRPYHGSDPHTGHLHVDFAPGFSGDPPGHPSR
jgi:hypothetical protein